jgi:hypothetical protein
MKKISFFKWVFALCLISMMMLYATDRYEVTYRLKGSKKTLKTTLLPATWDELKSRVPKKAQETPSSDYSFKILEKEIPQSWISEISMTQIE